MKRVFVGEDTFSRWMGLAFADEMGLRVRRHFFALDGPRVRRRNGSSCAKTLFRVGRASRSQTKWVFVCEDTFSRGTRLAFADEMGLRRKSPLAGGTVCGAKCDQSSGERPLFRKRIRGRV